jgi:hypothetical protein
MMKQISFLFLLCLMTSQVDAADCTNGSGWGQYYDEEEAVGTHANSGSPESSPSPELATGELAPVADDSQKDYPDATSFAWPKDLDPFVENCVEDPSLLQAARKAMRANQRRNYIIKCMQHMSDKIKELAENDEPLTPTESDGIHGYFYYKKLRKRFKEKVQPIVLTYPLLLDAEELAIFNRYCAILDLPVIKHTKPSATLG